MNNSQISDEAVEAAAKVAFQEYGAKYATPAEAAEDWHALSPRFKSAWLVGARMILEAAAPHMLAARARA